MGQSVTRVNDRESVPGPIPGIYDRPNVVVGRPTGEDTPPGPQDAPPPPRKKSVDQTQQSNEQQAGFRGRLHQGWQTTIGVFRRKSIDQSSSLPSEQQSQVQSNTSGGGGGGGRSRGGMKASGIEEDEEEITITKKMKEINPLSSSSSQSPRKSNENEEMIEETTIITSSSSPSTPSSSRSSSSPSSSSSMSSQSRGSQSAPSSVRRLNGETTPSSGGQSKPFGSSKEGTPNYGSINNTNEEYQNSKNKKNVNINVNEDSRSDSGSGGGVDGVPFNSSHPVIPIPGSNEYRELFPIPPKWSPWNVQPDELHREASLPHHQSHYQSSMPATKQNNVNPKSTSGNKTNITNGNNPNSPVMGYRAGLSPVMQAMLPPKYSVMNIQPDELHRERTLPHHYQHEHHDTHPRMGPKNPPNNNNSNNNNNNNNNQSGSQGGGGGVSPGGGPRHFGQHWPSASGHGHDHHNDSGGWPIFPFVPR